MAAHSPGVIRLHVVDQGSVLKKGYLFAQGLLPAGYRCIFRTAIFNQSTYREFQSQTGWRSFYVLSPSRYEAHASIHFFVVDGIARSPLRAPFGSLEFSTILPRSIVFRFLDYVDNSLKEAGVTQVIIKNPPDRYEPEAMALLSNFLLTREYRVMEHELGAIVPVSDKCFREIIHPRKKRKLNQCYCQGLSFVQLQRSSLPAVYDFIAACRMEKNFKLSLTRHELEKFVDGFPDEYLFFAVYHHKDMVAASVAIRPYPDVLYHFISDHIRKIGALRPALILMEGIYDFCQRANIKFVDLGTSTVDGRPNFKLVKFKTELGGELTHRFTFTKTFK